MNYKKEKSMSQLRIFFLLHSVVCYNQWKKESVLLSIKLFAGKTMWWHTLMKIVCTLTLLSCIHITCEFNDSTISSPVAVMNRQTCSENWWLQICFGIMRGVEGCLCTCLFINKMGYNSNDVQICLVLFISLQMLSLGIFSCNHSLLSDVTDTTRSLQIACNENMCHLQSFLYMCEHAEHAYVPCMYIFGMYKQDFSGSHAWIPLFVHGKNTCVASVHPT